MKKILVFLFAMLMAVSCVLLVACASNVTKITIQGAPTQVERGAEIKYEDISLKVEYDDGTEATLALDDNGVTYTPVDTSTTGDKTLRVSYGGKSADATIKVVEGAVDETATILSFDNTDAYEAYLDAKADKENKESQFVKQDVLYTVGNNNGYVFLPKTLADWNEETVTLEAVKTTYEISLKNGADYARLDATAEKTYLSKVEDNIYYFTEAAAGKEFKLVVKLDGSYEVLSENLKTKELVQEIRVVDGYNVYTARGLSMLDNANKNSWKEIKEKTSYAWDGGKKLSEITGVTQVVLHSNLTITPADLPSNYFWTEGEGVKENGASGNLGYTAAKNNVPKDNGFDVLFDGSLKQVFLGEDWELNWENKGTDNSQHGLYTSDGIGLSGNYLSLSYETGYKVNDDGTVTRTAKQGIYLVYGHNMNEGPKNYPDCQYSFISYRQLDDSAHNSAHIENVYFVGQTRKTENDKIPTGLQMISSNIDTVTLDNVIGQQWFCNLTLDTRIRDNNSGSASVNDSKFYDSYSQMLYSFLSDGMTIRNCEMKRAGGPLIIAHTWQPNGDGVYKDVNTVIDIDDDSVLESWVTGQEMWFTVNNLPASDVAQLLGLMKLANATIQGNYAADAKGEHPSPAANYVNLVAVVIPDPGRLMTNQNAIQGTIKTGDVTYAMNDEVFNAMISLNAIAGKGLENDLVTNTIGAINSAPDEALPADKKEEYAGMINSLNEGLMALAASHVMPVFKCGNDYGYSNGTSFSALSDMQQLYGGALYVQAQLNTFADMYTQAGDAQTAGQLSFLANAWGDIAANANLTKVGTYTGATESWNAGYMAMWVNMGANASNPLESQVKHFMILFGESTHVAAAQ